MLKKHFNDAIRLHLKNSSKCDGNVTFNAENIIKTGLGLRTSLHCKKCGFQTDNLRFFEETIRDGRGRRPAKINTQLSVALAKNPVGASTFIEILSTCEVITPALENLRKSVNKAADTFVAINEDQLAENRQVVKNEIISRYSKNTTKVQCDASYNNSPKGRSFSQPGTQAYCPMFSSEEGMDKVPLAVATVSKLCSCPYNSSGIKTHKQNCQMNYSPEKAISNAEYVLGQSCARELLQDNIVPSEVVTDGVGGGALYKGINSIVKEGGHNSCINQDCSKHMSSTLRRNMRKIQLQSVYINDTVALRKKQTRSAFRLYSETCCLGV